MSEFDFDFEELLGIAKEAGFATVPPGTYHVEVERAEHTMTSTDKPMIKVMYRLIPGLNGEVKGTVWNNFVISRESAAALSFFFRHMKAMGLPEEYFRQKPRPTMDEVCAALIGRPCRIKVENRAWNDLIQPDVKNVMPPVAGPGTVGTPSTVASRPGPAPAAAAQPGPAAASASVAVNGGNGNPGPAPAAAPTAAQPSPAPTAPSF